MNQGRPPADTDIVSPMLLLLRKYARGARILAVRQPRFERILHLTFAQADYDDDDDEDDLVDLDDEYGDVDEHKPRPAHHKYED